MLIKIGITIQKSEWLDEQALLRVIRETLAWKLATGGCKIIEWETQQVEEDDKNASPK